MGTESIPLGLFKANIELQLRITRLLQDSGQQWLESAQRAGADSIAETTSEIESLLRAGNWQSLATLPAESFWRLIQQRTGDAQAINQTVIKNQAQFTTGLQQALESWQRSVLGAIGEDSAAQPLQDLFKQWGQAWTAATAPAPKKNDKGA